MLTLDQMRTLLRRGLGNLSVDDLSDEDADLYLNLSLWNLSERFPFKEKECIVTSQTAKGQAEYGVPDILDAIYGMSVVDDDGQTRKLIRMNMDTYEELRKEVENAPDKHMGRPGRYVRWRDTIYLYPIPDKVYNLRLIIWRTINSLLEGDIDAPELPRNWHEIVVEGAVTRGHYFNEDYNLAQQAENFRVGHERSAVLETMKEKRDSRFARVRVIHEFPEEFDKVDE